MRIASDVASVAVQCGELNNCVAQRTNKVVARSTNSNTAAGNIPASHNTFNSNLRGADSAMESTRLRGSQADHNDRHHGEERSKSNGGQIQRRLEAQAGHQPKGPSPPRPEWSLARSRSNTRTWADARLSGASCTRAERRRELPAEMSLRLFGSSAKGPPTSFTDPVEYTECRCQRARCSSEKRG